MSDLTPFFQGLLASLIGGVGFLCAFVALSACMRSSQISQASKDEDAGAPEGAFSFIHLHVERNR